MRVTLIGVVMLVASLFIKESIDFYRGRNVPRCRATEHVLNRLQMNLSDYVLVHGSLPKSTIHDAINAMQKEKMDCSVLSAFISKPGFDAWGHELIYEVLDEKHAVIRSVGPNGVDEKGGGDDMQREVPTP